MESTVHAEDLELEAEGSRMMSTGRSVNITSISRYVNLKGDLKRNILPSQSSIRLHILLFDEVLPCQSRDYPEIRANESILNMRATIL